MNPVNHSCLEALLPLLVDAQDDEFLRGPIVDLIMRLKMIYQDLPELIKLSEELGKIKQEYSDYEKKLWELDGGAYHAIQTNEIRRLKNLIDITHDKHRVKITEMQQIKRKLEKEMLERRARRNDQ